VECKVTQSTDFRYVLCYRNWNVSVSVVTRLRATQSGLDSRQVQGRILFATTSTPALGLIQPPIQWG